MSAAAFRVALPGPVDVPASAEFLRRNGDDLMDRWTGDQLVRVLIVAGHRVPVAMRPVGGPDEPGLLVTVAGRPADLDQARLSTAVAAQFATAGPAWPLLLAADRPLAALVARSPEIRPLLLTDPLYALVRAITAQQVNLKFATAIRARLARELGTAYQVDGQTVYVLEPEALAAADPVALRAMQLSERKAGYLREVARAVLDGRLDPARLAALEHEEYLRTMTAVRGIGRWTADWFAARVLRQPVVVAGDVGLRKAVGMLYGAAMPTELEVRRLTAHWGEAAHLAQQFALESLAPAPAAPVPPPAAVPTPRTLPNRHPDEPNSASTANTANDTPDTHGPNNTNGAAVFPNRLMETR